MGRRAKSTKGKAEATRAPAGTSPKDEGAKVRDLEKRLAEALQREQVLVEQQTATAEILSVISSSPTDVQPVFDTITQNALELCGAASSLLTTFDGELLHLAALANVRPGVADPLRRVYPMRPGRGAAGARAILTRAVVHIPDLREDPEYALRDLVQALDFRSVLAVPMLREGKPIGTINVHKGDPEPFSESQIALLQTFAAQAVIAIENVRLFTELQEKNSALTESLEQQTATSEILRVISHSPTDVQPVFDTIVRNAVRLCGALQGGVYRFDGELVHSVAHDGYTAEQLQQWRATWPQPVTAPSVACQSIRTRSPVRIRNFETAPELVILTADTLANLLARGSRSVMAVPMFRQNEVIGAISLAHREVDAFSDTHVELLKTFADQAVIAIENVRLFKELETRNRDLTEALEQQTATAEVLRVISSSPTDLQPVLATVAENAARVCGAIDAQIYRVEGEFLRWVASHGPIPPNLGKRPINRGWVSGRAVVDCRTVHVHDLAAESDTEYPIGKADQLQTGHRTTLATPLLREGVPLGVVSIRRLEVLPFSEKQMALLQTFADQAVIAIENVRLFKELQARTAELTESVEKLTALGEVSQALSSTLDLDTVLTTIVNRAVHLSGADGGRSSSMTKWRRNSSRARVMRSRTSSRPPSTRVSGRARERWAVWP